MGDASSFRIRRCGALALQGVGRTGARRSGILRKNRVAAANLPRQGGPSRDWLNPERGYVHSHRARTKVRQWFKAQQLEETIAQGRAMVERELSRHGRSALKLEAVAAKAGFPKLDDFFAAVARDDINSKQVQIAIHAVAQRESIEPAPVAEPEVVTRKS